ncbi:MAG TPA: sulfurtransferase [Thermomicrobiales bacterium]|nr:sulfurtransferase [Thermomicrobiales bacterium]
MPTDSRTVVDPAFAAYAHPDVLVTTQWVADHLDDPNVRVLESDEDIMLYEIGHIPGSLKLDWLTQMQQQVDRDFVDKAGFETLCSERGITPEMTVVFYGDVNNWYATYGFWLFKYFGHDDVRVMDGGRAKWEAEGRPWTREVPDVAPTQYVAKDADNAIRAFRDDVLRQVEEGTGPLVDVRSNAEYTGELLHAIGYPQEGAQRAGHIKGAHNVPWGTAANADGTFKSAEELRKLYGDHGVTGDEPIIAYCRIGERSSHTWFVLKYLLGYDDVRNYDGSWTEWGSLVGVPNATGNEPG